MTVSDSARTSRQVPEFMRGVHIVSRTSAPDLADAVYLIDKPGGWTSHDVVRHLKSSSGTRKVGHAGTLDPLATGLLICMTGSCTRKARFFLEMDKEYEGTLRLGETTPSYDADTPVERAVGTGHVTTQEIVAAAAAQTGDIVQQSPPYSAVRVEGERLYRRARRGDRRSGPPRMVTVYDFEIQRRRGPDVDFRLICSKGTYVRAIAHEVGQQLGVGAHLTRLRRIRIGGYSVAEALRPEALGRPSEHLAAKTRDVDHHAG